MDDRPIGVFDSGLGGLTAVKQLRSLLPGESIVYFGDTGRVPYGNRSRETVRAYAKQDMAFLMGKDVKAVLAACGTVSSLAPDIGEALPVPYFDVVGPTARAAARATRNGRIAVTGTSATVRSGSYERALKRENGALSVFRQACPLFVPLVENGFISPADPVTSLVAERYLGPLKAEGVDVLILGCTHFPLLRETVARVMGPDVVLIDSGREAALALADALGKQGLLAGPGHVPTEAFWVSDDPEDFKEVAERFLGRPISGELRRTAVE